MDFSKMMLRKIHRQKSSEIRMKCSAPHLATNCVILNRVIVRVHIPMLIITLVLFFWVKTPDPYANARDIAPGNNVRHCCKKSWFRILTLLIMDILYPANVPERKKENYQQWHLPHSIWHSMLWTIIHSARVGIWQRIYISRDAQGPL